MLCIIAQCLLLIAIARGHLTLGRIFASVCIRQADYELTPWGRRAGREAMPGEAGTVVSCACAACDEPYMPNGG